MERRIRFESLFRAHAGAVRSYALRRTDASTADDVVADVFLVVWRRLDQVPEQPLPWLLGIARRVLANSTRGASRRTALTERLSATATPGATAATQPSDLGVACALRALRERDRELLLLIAWDGLTPAEAAAALGLGRGAFAVALHRARRRFARLLAEQSNASEHSGAVEVPT
jgi:RNA polymerase sigma-70 factor (ECF subfamily)